MIHPDIEAMVEAFYRHACAVSLPDPTDFTPEITRAVQAMIDAKRVELGMGEKETM